MTETSFIAFFIAAIILAITPGPGIAYVVARTVSGGKQAGMASSLGTAVGGFVHVLAAALGLSLLISQSAFAFQLVKYCGAAYLIYLGIKILLTKNEPHSLQKVERSGIRRVFFEGIVVESLNVKTALFFLAFLPQFTSSNAPLTPQLIMLGSICVLLNTLVDVLAVLTAHKMLMSTAARATREKVMTKVSGITMLGLGSYLALVERE